VKNYVHATVREATVVKVVMWSRGESMHEVRLEQTPYPFPTQVIWRYLGIK